MSLKSAFEEIRRALDRQHKEKVAKLEETQRLLEDTEPAPIASAKPAAPNAAAPPKKRIRNRKKTPAPAAAQPPKPQAPVTPQGPIEK